MTARLAEIMESIQGEGLLVGTRSIFLRFSGCNMDCSYCDTPAARESSPHCQIAQHTGRWDAYESLLNPLTPEQVLEAIRGYSARWISMTGGEPLLWADFIANLGRQLKPAGYHFLLETNGTLYTELDKCLPYIDMISMDYKLPSATGEDCRTRHQEFLSRTTPKPIYVKIVVDALTKRAEIQDAVTVISAVSSHIPLILQPVSPCGDAAAPSMQMLLDLQQFCMLELQDVRVIPQIHKFMGLI